MIQKSIFALGNYEKQGRLSILFSYIIFMLCPSFLIGQPAIQWSELYGGTRSEFGRAIQKTADKGYIIAGVSKSNDGDLTGHYGEETSWDGWVIKLDQEGKIQWQRHYGGTGFDKLSDIQPTHEGGYIVSGYTTSSDGDLTENKGSDDAWIIKLNALGEIEWQKTYGGSHIDEARTIRQLRNGGYLVAGTSYSTDGDVTTNKRRGNFWVFQISDAGEIDWQKIYGGNETEIVFDMKLTEDGGSVVVGNALSSDGDLNENKGKFDSWIIKLDSIGNLQWQHTYGGSENDNAISVQPTFDGGYVIAGGTYSSDGDVSFTKGEDDFWVLKLNADGTLQWQQTYGGSGVDRGIAVIQTSDSGYLVGGESNSADGDLSGNYGEEDAWLLKIDSIGQIQWQKNIGGSAFDSPFKLLELEHMDYVIVGISYSSDGDLSDNHGNADLWVCKLSNTTSNTAVAPILQGIAIFPNPLTNNTLNLEFQTNEHRDLIIEVTNSLGKKVLIENQVVHSGNNNIRLNLPKIPAGVYFITLKTAEQVFTKKLEKFE